MTRLEIDIDMQGNDPGKCHAEMRVVRECTTGREKAVDELRVANAIKSVVMQLLGDAVRLSEEATER